VRPNKKGGRVDPLPYFAFFRVFRGHLPEGFQIQEFVSAESGENCQESKKPTTTPALHPAVLWLFAVKPPQSKSPPANAHSAAYYLSGRRPDSLGVHASTHPADTNFPSGKIPNNAASRALGSVAKNRPPNRACRPNPPRYRSAMSTAQEIEVAALKLPRQKRAALADRLMGSLATRQELKIAAGWHDEAQARSEAHRRGKIKSVPLHQAFGFEV